MGNGGPIPRTAIATAALASESPWPEVRSSAEDGQPISNACNKTAADVLLRGTDITLSNDTRSTTEQALVQPPRQAGKKMRR